MMPFLLCRWCAGIRRSARFKSAVGDRGRVRSRPGRLCLPRRLRMLNMSLVTHWTASYPRYLDVRRKRSRTQQSTVSYRQRNLPSPTLAHRHLVRQQWTILQHWHPPRPSCRAHLSISYYTRNSRAHRAGDVVRMRWLLQRDTSRPRGAGAMGTAREQVQRWDSARTTGTGRQRRFSIIEIQHSHIRHRIHSSINTSNRQQSSNHETGTKGNTNTSRRIHHEQTRLPGYRRHPSCFRPACSRARVNPSSARRRGAGHRNTRSVYNSAL